MKRNVVVDEVGRLVLPKEIREAIGVFGRTSVQVEVVNNIAQLSAVEMTDGTLEHKGKRTVFGGALPENWDSGEAVLKAFLCRSFLLAGARARFPAFVPNRKPLSLRATKLAINISK
jgi:hypothetical protein